MDLLLLTPPPDSNTTGTLFGCSEGGSDVLDPSTPNFTWYSMFSSLPPEIQAIVTKYVDRKTLSVLCLVNKHFHQLSIPQIYSRVDLFCHYVSKGWCGTGLIRAQHRVKWRQTQFCTTIEAHPELAAWTQILLWGKHRKIWDVLALMPRLRHIRLEGMHKISDTSVPGTDAGIGRHYTFQGPERFPWGVFSRLESISASGSYVAGGLSGILVNSPRLRSLSLTGGAKEELLGREDLASIAPVLDACISLPQGLPNLRWLELERFVFINNEHWLEPEAPALQAWHRFLSRFGGQLEHLVLRLEKRESSVKFDPEAAFKTNIFPLFTAGTFVALKSLRLTGFNLSADDESAIRRLLPLEVVIKKSPRITPRNEL